MKYLRTLGISKWGRALLGLFIVWLIIMIMAAKPMFNSNNSQDQEANERLSQAFRELKLLKKQNSELKKLFTEFNFRHV